MERIYTGLGCTALGLFTAGIASTLALVVLDKPHLAAMVYIAAAYPLYTGIVSLVRAYSEARLDHEGGDE